MRQPSNDAQKRARAIDAEARRFKGLGSAGTLILGSVAPIARAAAVSRPTIYSWRKDPEYLAEIPLRIADAVAAKMASAGAETPKIRAISENAIYQFVRANWQGSAEIPGEAKRYHDPNSYAQALMMRGLIPAELVAKIRAAKV
jgi:hypothetical protein